MAKKKETVEETEVKEPINEQSAPNQEETPVQESKKKLTSKQVFEPMLRGYKTVWVEE